MQTREVVLSHLTIGAPPLETIRAASAGGFTAVGIRLCGRRLADTYPASVIDSPTAVRAIRQELDDLGVRLASVNALQFYPEVTWDSLAPIVDCAAQLGSPVIIANVFDQGPLFMERFGRFSDAAGAAGIRIALEFLPYSRIRSLAAALRLVEENARASVGLLVDALHLDRSGGRPSDLAALRADQVVFAQLCDAMTQSSVLPDDELMRQARTARMELGAGELPLHEFIDALPADVELEYEVVRADIADQTPETKARAARLDVDRFMQVRQSRRSQQVAI